MSRTLLSLAGTLLLGISSTVVGQTYEPIHNWRHEGAQPTGRLLYLNGAYYGTTFGGGALASGTTNFEGRGTAFKLAADGTLDILQHFDGFDLGANPEGGLTLGQDGNFYGLAKFGVLGSQPSGSGGHGTIYQITPAGVGTRIFALSSGAVGANPVGELLERSPGNFLGFTGNIVGSTSVLFATSPNPFSYEGIASFNENSTGKAASGLIRGTDDNFYGTSRNRVFRLNAADNTTTFLRAATDFDQGSVYSYGLVQGSDGRLYGITENGGLNSNGVIWAMNLDGTGYTVLRHLATEDGRYARCRLLSASDGALYGTTRFGGAYDKGTLFRITPGGDFAKLHDFTGADGADPRSLIEANGKLAGVAASGGLTDRGVIFEATLAGEVTVRKHLGSPDGFIPNGPLTFASDGNAYGVLAWGGPAGHGAIYRLTPAGDVELVHGLAANEGIHPKYRLIEGADGALYGVTVGAFTQLQGGVFRVTKDGSSFSVLQALSGTPSDPNFGGIRGPLVERPDGRIYGVSGQGSSAATKVFRLSSTASFEVTKEIPDSQLHSVLSRYFLDEAGALWFFATDPAAENGAGAIGLFKLAADGTLTGIGSTGFAVAVTAPTQGADGAFYLLMRPTPTGAASLVRCTPTGQKTATALTASGTIPQDAFRGDLVEREPGVFFATSSTAGANALLTHRLHRIDGATGEVTTLHNFGALDFYRRVSLTQFIGAGVGGTAVLGGIYVDPSISLGPDDHLYGTVPQDTAQAGGQLYRYVLPPREGPVPLAQTGESGEVTASTAEVNATVNPNGVQAHVSIEFGQTSAYGYRTFPADAGSGSADVPVAFKLACLSPGTTYHYRTVATGPGGAVYGADQTFTTDPNLSPIANGDEASVRVVTPLAAVQIPVLLNDADAENDPLVVSSFTPPARGTLALNAGVFTYTPGPGFNADDSFSYTITDGFTTATALVVIRAVPNAAPLALGDTANLRAKEKVTVAVLANDSDPDGDAFSLTSHTQPTFGSVARTGNDLIYTPGPNFAGTDSFSYTITDAVGATATGQVAIVNPFLDLKGSYAVLLEAGRGLLKLNVTTAGAFTGSVRLPSGIINLKGSLALDGSYSTKITRKNKPVVVVTLAFGPAGLGGQIQEGTETLLFAEAAPLAVGLPAGIFVGNFTAVFTPPPTGPAELDSYGWAKGRTAKSGQITLAGQMPDGSPFSLGGLIRQDKTLVAYKASRPLRGLPS